MQIKVDVKGFEKYAEKLQKLHRAAIPNAIRGTLNTAAFDVKKTTMPKQAEKAFINRSKNFFKANSTVDKATGFDTRKMQATVGFSEDKLKNKSTNYAVKDLEQQEKGGKIDGRSFIPMKTARISNSETKNVKAQNRISDVRKNNFTPTNRKSAKSKKQQFIRAALYAQSKGDGYVLGFKTSKGGRTLWKIDRISQNVKSRKLRIKARPIMNVKKGRKVNVSATHFMKKSAILTSKKIDRIFVAEAQRQFKKYMK